MKKMSKGKKSGTGKLLAGLAIGAGLGVLFAPKKGSDTRKDFKLKIDELLQKAKELDMKEVKENIETRIFELKEQLSDLDKEKALEIAKKKARDIQDAAEDLVEYAVEKGTPILESTANSVREKAIGVTREILKKLEKGE